MSTLHLLFSLTLATHKYTLLNFFFWEIGTFYSWEIITFTCEILVHSVITLLLKPWDNNQWIRNMRVTLLRLWNDVYNYDSWITIGHWARNMWLTIYVNLKWDTFRHFGVEHIRWQCEQYATEGYRKSNLTYLVFTIWIYSPICEYNNPASSLHFTLQHKYIMKPTSTINHVQVHKTIRNYVIAI